MPALEAVGVDRAALANNHLRDFGDVALRDTLDRLDDAVDDERRNDRSFRFEVDLTSAGDLEGLRRRAVEISDWADERVRRERAARWRERAAAFERVDGGLALAL